MLGRYIPCSMPFIHASSLIHVFVLYCAYVFRTGEIIIIIIIIIITERINKGQS